eukprot:Filipodium_phascolosomae@DN1695_c0_g1_i1.p1
MKVFEDLKKGYAATYAVIVDLKLKKLLLELSVVLGKGKDKGVLLTDLESTETEALRKADKELKVLEAYFQKHPTDDTDSDGMVVIIKSLGGHMLEAFAAWANNSRNARNHGKNYFTDFVNRGDLYDMDFYEDMKDGRMNGEAMNGEAMKKAVKSMKPHLQQLVGLVAEVDPDMTNSERVALEMAYLHLQQLDLFDNDTKVQLYPFDHALNVRTDDEIVILRHMRLALLYNLFEEDVNMKTVNRMEDRAKSMKRRRDVYKKYLLKIKVEGKEIFSHNKYRINKIEEILADLYKNFGATTHYETQEKYNLKIAIDRLKQEDLVDVAIFVRKEIANSMVTAMNAWKSKGSSRPKNEYYDRMYNNNENFLEQLKFDGGISVKDVDERLSKLAVLLFYGKTKALSYETAEMIKARREETLKLAKSYVMDGSHMSEEEALHELLGPTNTPLVLSEWDPMAADQHSLQEGFALEAAELYLGEYKYFTKKAETEIFDVDFRYSKVLWYLRLALLYSLFEAKTLNGHTQSPIEFEIRGKRQMLYKGFLDEAMEKGSVDEYITEKLDLLKFGEDSLVANFVAEEKASVDLAIKEVYEYDYSQRKQIKQKKDE